MKKHAETLAHRAPLKLWCLLLGSHFLSPRTYNSRATIDSLTSSGIIFITWNSHQNVHQLIKPVSANTSSTFIFFSGIVFLHYLIKDPTEFLKRWLQALSCLGGYIILEMLKTVHFLWNHFKSEHWWSQSKRLVLWICLVGRARWPGFCLTEGTLRASEETCQLNDAEAEAVSGPYFQDPVLPSPPGCVLMGKERPKEHYNQACVCSRHMVWRGEFVRCFEFHSGASFMTFLPGWRMWGGWGIEMMSQINERGNGV